MTNIDLFIKQFPNLFSYLAGDFPYSTVSDEETADQIGKKLKQCGESGEWTLNSIIKEGDQVLTDIDRMWNPLAQACSKDFKNKEDAHKWLSRILDIWKSHAADR